MKHTFRLFFTPRGFALAAIATAFTIGAVSVPIDGMLALIALGALAQIAAGIRQMASGHYVLGVIDTTLVANTIQPHYSKKLLEKAVQLTRLTEYAQLEELPAGSGNTVRFFRPPSADLTVTGAPAVLTQGVAPTNYRDIAYTPIDVSLVQIGQVAKVTDVANTVGLVKYLDTAIEVLGEDFALDVETRMRDILTHAATGFTKRYAQGAANFAAVAAATAANAAPVPRDLLDAMTRLKLNRAPTVNGHYVAYVPAQFSRDILNNAEWREVIRATHADKVFKGEIGDLFGLRVVEGTVPFQEDETEGTYATTFSGLGTNTTGFVYTTLVMGKNAFGAVNMKKLGGSVNKPTIVIVDKPDSNNPLAQFILVGWKAYWASVNLNAAWGIALRHKTQFTG